MLDQARTPTKRNKKYILIVVAMIVITLLQACVNMIVSYKFLLDSVNGVDYGLIIGCQIVASSFFAPKIVYFLESKKFPAVPLSILYVFSAILYLFVAFFSEFSYFLLFIFLITIIMIVQSAIVYKLVPIVMNENEVKLYNIWSEQAASMAFMGSALIVPAAFFFLKSYKEFFIAASFVNMLVGVIFYLIFCEILIPVVETQTKQESTLQTYLNIFSESWVRHFFITSNFYLFAFSATAFTLAMIAKNIVKTDIYEYSIPIIAMYSGRLISLTVMRRYIAVNIQNIFLVGCIASACFMFPLGLIRNIYILSVLEFFLGFGIALAKYSERAFYQTTMKNADLSKISLVRSVAALVNKSLSIPLIIYLIYIGNAEIVSAMLAAFYLVAGLTMWRNVIRQNALAELPVV